MMFDGIPDDAGPIRSVFITWFPAEQFALARRRWPAFDAEFAGQDHDMYRYRLETLLHDVVGQAADAGFQPAIRLVAIHVDEYERWCATGGHDPADQDTRVRYAGEASADGTTPWPPAPDEVCWCGSGRPYRSCCAPVDADAGGDVASLVQQYLDADWAGRRALVAGYPVLLDERLGEVLGEVVDTYRPAGQPADEMRRAIGLLADCRTGDPDTVFGDALLQDLAVDPAPMDARVRDAARQFSRAMLAAWSDATGDTHAAKIAALRGLGDALAATGRSVEEQRRIRRVLIQSQIGAPGRDAAASVAAAAADAHAMAEELPEDDAADQARQLAQAGELWWIRVRLAFDASAVDRGIAAFRAAFAEAPAGWPERAASAVSLGELYEQRFAAYGNTNDLDTAVEWLRDARPAGLVAVHRLAGALRTRYLSQRDLGDLDEAIELMTDADRALTGRGPHPDGPDPDGPRSDGLDPDGQEEPDEHDAVRSTLGMVLRQRFEVLGRTADLDRAIAVYQPMIDGGGENAVFAYNNLGVALLTRYRRRNDPADLDLSITHLRTAVDESPLDSQVRWERVHNLCNALVTRASRVPVADDLTAIRHYCAELAPATADRPVADANRLAWSAIAHGLTVIDAGDVGPDEAIRLCEEALGMLPSAEPERPLLLDVLIRVLLTRGEEAALDRATELARFAARAPDHLLPYLPAQQLTLASVLRTRGSRRAAHRLYRQISGTLTHGDLASRARAATAWVESARQHGPVGEVPTAEAAARRVIAWRDAVWDPSDGYPERLRRALGALRALDRSSLHRVPGGMSPGDNGPALARAWAEAFAAASTHLPEVPQVAA